MARPLEQADPLGRRVHPAVAVAWGVLVAIAPGGAGASPADDQRIVAELDTQYQAAVKANDAATMDRILADDFVLVTGRGHAYGKADLLDQARKQSTIYERQEEEAGTQTVRVWGDAAVVTALLWIKGTREGTPIDSKLWFSDVYLRRPEGWRYVFGQASLRLPDEGNP